MASSYDLSAVEHMIDALIGGRSDPLNEQEVWLTAEALTLVCSNYTAEELASIIVRAALKKGERAVQCGRLDS